MRNMEALVLVFKRVGLGVEYFGWEHRFAALKVAKIRPVLAARCLTNRSPLLVE
tara:strand:- start:501 stop:662 length:162 start_codon:yes stop_codon:yes gene_type:complete